MADNEYVDLLDSDPKLSGQSEPVNEYDQMLDDDRSAQRQQIQTSMFQAARGEPDRKAQVLELSKRTNLPPAIVERNFDDIAQKDTIHGLDYDGLIDETPGLAKFLEHPDDATLAKDDIPQLQKVEQTIRDHGFLESAYNALGSGFARMNAGIYRVPGLLYNVAALPQNLAYKAMGMPERQVKAPDFIMDNPLAKRADEAAIQFAQRSPEISQSISQAAGGGDYARAGRIAAIQFIANAPQQAALLASMMTGAGEAGLVGAGLTTAADKMKEAQDQGFDPATGTVAAVATGSIEAMFESIGTFGAFKSWSSALTKQYGREVSVQVTKDMLKTLAQSVAAEANEEFLTSLAQDAVDKFSGLNRQADQGMFQRAVDAGIVGGLSGGLMTSPAAFTQVAAQHREAVRTKDFYTQLGDSVSQTKLLKRLPEAKRRLLEKMTEGTPVENVFIPVQALTTYFQDSKTNPVAVMQKLDALQSFEEAKQTGADVKIPLAKWVTGMVGTEHYQALANDVKFRADGLTVNEAMQQAEIERQVVEQLKAQAEAAKANPQEQTAQDSAKIVGETVAKQLEAAGVDPEQAVIFEAGFRTLGHRLNMDPLELFNQFKLRIGFGDQAPTAGAPGAQVMDQGPNAPKYGEFIVRPDMPEVVQKTIVDPVSERGQVTTIEAAREYALNNLRNRSVRNTQTGMDIDLPAKGIREVTRPGSKDRMGTILGLTYLDQLMQRAVYDGAENLEKPKSGIYRYHRFYAPLVANGTEYLVRIKVAETDNGNKFYHEIGIESERPADMTGSRPSSTDGGAYGVDPSQTMLPSGAFSGTVNINDFADILNATRRKNTFFQNAVPKPAPIKQQLEDALGKDLNLEFEDGGYTRDVDHMEPLPNLDSARRRRAEKLGFDTDYSWFHGSRADIESFSGDTLGASTGAGSARMAHFFASSPHTASDYAEASDDALTLRSSRTEAEAARAKEDFTARMREKYGPKWTSHLTASEKAERKRIKTRFEQAAEDFANSQEGTDHKVKWLRYEIELAKNNIADLEKNLRARTFEQENKKTQEWLNYNKSLLDNKEWVIAEGGRFYNVIDKNTGEKVVNKHFTDKPESQFKFYDNPDRVKEMIAKIEARIASNTEANLKESIKESQQDLQEKEDKLLKILQGTEGQVVYPVLLKMLNPLIVDFKGAEYREVTYRQILDQAQQNGYDGVIFKNTYDPAFKGGANYELIDVAAVFEPQQVRSVNAKFKDPDSPNILAQPGDDGPRGQIEIGAQGIDIKILKNADASTFLHETGHFYLQVLETLASKEETPAQIKDDLKILREWMGAKEGEALTVEQHEMFARGFEAYLMEGKAPSQELRSAFARFKVWLISVYRQLVNLNVNLTNDVRGVMDRLLATDEEINQVLSQQNMMPLFADPEAVGLTGEKLERYNRAREEARFAAEEELSSKLMQEFQREKEAWFKKQRARVRSEFEDQVNQQRIYKALSILQRGKLADGSALPEGMEAIKLSKQILTEKYGKDFLKRLPRPYVYSAEGGLHPDVAAELLGFESGDDLVTQIANAQKKDDLLDQMADVKMKELHPSLMDGPSLTEEAIKAVHNDKRSELLRMELEHLASNDLPVFKDVIRRVVKRVPSDKVVREKAKNIIAQRKVSELSPYLFQRAEAKAAKEAGEALAKGDIDAAFEAKNRELLNHELYRSAREAQELVDKALESFKRIQKADEKLAKTRDMDLVNAARAILAMYGLGKTDAPPDTYLAQIRRYDPETYATVEALVGSVQQGSGEYKSVTFDNFQAMADTVSALWDLARSNRQIEIDGQAMEREQVIDELNAALSNIGDGGKPAGYEKAVTDWDKAKLSLLGIRAALRRVESWVDAMDLGEITGPFRRYIWTPISEATARYREAKKTVLEQYLELAKNLEPNLSPDEIKAPELGYTFAGKQELIGAILHTGNDSNLQKLLRGRNWGEIDDNGNLDTSRWDSFLRRMAKEGVLVKADYDFVQGVWDMLEEMKPEAQKVHKRIYGHYFSEITAQEVQTPFGTYRGGYVPAVADPFIAQDAAIREEKAALEGLNNSFMFPTAGRGFTKKRVEMYAKPLALDLRFVPAHIDKVMRFIHIEPHVKEIGRLVMDRTFRENLDRFDPAVGGDMLVPWLQRAALQKIETPSSGWAGRAADNFFRALRTRTGLQIMAGNVTNAMQQLTGLSIGAIKVKPKHLRDSLWAYVRAPKETAQAVSEKSLYMRNDLTSSAHEIMATVDDLLLNPNKYEKARDFAKRHGQFLQKGTQNVVNVVVWTGAYNQAVESGLNELEAVRSADSAVRLTQGSFAAEDVSRFETGAPFVRAFTMFYSYFNMQANLLGTEFQRTTREMGLKKGAGRLLYLYTFGFMIPAVMAEMIVRAMSGKPFDEDDDESYLDDIFSVFFGSQVRAASAMFPGIGPSVNAGINAFNDKWYDDRISTSPSVSLIESAVSAPHSVYAAITEDGKRKKAVRDTLSLLGLMTGMPLAPLARPIGYLSDIEEGNTEPSGPIDFARGLVTGKSGQSR